MVGEVLSASEGRAVFVANSSMYNLKIVKHSAIANPYQFVPDAEFGSILRNWAHNAEQVTTLDDRVTRGVDLSGFLAYVIQVMRSMLHVIRSHRNAIC
jgi:hypothetical protein